MRLIHFRPAVANFGDDINADLWPRLAPGLFDEADDTGFLGVGTIIGMPTPEVRFLHVFSSGIGYDRLDDWHVPHRIWCVRGPLTARVLDCDPALAATDGAILAPLAMPMPQSADAPIDVGVMPHWESLRFPGWPAACRRAGFTLISPIATPAAVLPMVQRCRLLLTESLHGAIIADSYGVPWIPIMTTANFSVFKWADWCLSMGVPLAPVLVPPPSLAAPLRYGRPKKGRWGDRVAFDAEEAIAEYVGRIHHAPAPSIPARPTNAAGLLRQSLSNVALLRQIGGLAAGYSPIQSARYLRRASQHTATLSAEARRDSLRDRMTSRLRELCAIAARERAA